MTEQTIELQKNLDYASGLLYAAQILIERASIYVEDRQLIDEINAHLERVEQFHGHMIAEYKKNDTDEKNH